MKEIWFATLVATICFEGLGRKYLSQVPAVVFYFVKDIVLLLGLFRFRPQRNVTQASLFLYRGFKIIWVLGFMWTFIQLFNPEQSSGVLGLIGMRAYWLWWVAPLVVATILQDERVKRRAIFVLLFSATAVALFAALQFASPSNSALNIYSVVDGEEVQQTVVAATGRGRVSSTFSYISGFANFTILIPTLLLSFGLDAKDRRLQRYAFIVTCLTAAVVPMSGSRASVLMGGAILIIAVWSAGLFFTRIGRRILIAAAGAAVFAVVAFPDAFIGVQSRFEDAEETNQRYVLAAAAALPPVALATFEYPFFGIGTGMQQNARHSLRIPVSMEVEAEVGRYLVELGPVGFILIWSTKAGLLVALLRAYRYLKRAGRRGGATAALSYAVLTAIGNLAFDHIWQALYFMGCGFILAEVIGVMRARAAMPTSAVHPAVAPATVVRSAAAVPAAAGGAR